MTASGLKSFTAGRCSLYPKGLNGKTTITYPDRWQYVIAPDGAIIDHVLANPGIDVRAYLDGLINARDPRVCATPPPGTALA